MIGNKKAGENHQNCEINGGMKSNLGPQKVRHWGAAHWGSRMARVGLLHGIGSLRTIKWRKKNQTIPMHESC